MTLLAYHRCLSHALLIFTPTHTHVTSTVANLSCLQYPFNDSLNHIISTIYSYSGHSQLDPTQFFHHPFGRQLLSGHATSSFKACTNTHTCTYVHPQAPKRMADQFWQQTPQANKLNSWSCQYDSDHNNAHPTIRSTVGDRLISVPVDRGRAQTSPPLSPTR